MSLAAQGFEPPIPSTSSVPEPLPADQEQLFRAVLQALEDAKIPYAVSGAFALRQHTGICRYTKDLDVFLTPDDASRALALLSKDGFKCEVTDPVWLDCFELTRKEGELAGRLKKNWSGKGRTLTLADMIVAAIALKRRCTLMTDNRRDFPMAELDCYPFRRYSGRACLLQRLRPSKR